MKQSRVQISSNNKLQQNQFQMRSLVKTLSNNNNSNLVKTLNNNNNRHRFYLRSIISYLKTTLNNKFSNQFQVIV